jgi:hypothetical protein
MKQSLVLILIACLLVSAAAAQAYEPQSGCENGQCPPVSGQIDARAIVRIVNARGTSRAMGTGTLIDADEKRGLVVTCAHLFRDGAGSTAVIFPSGRSFGAQLARIDTTADLAALWIDAPDIEPVKVAMRSPQRGDALVSCGYGTDGRLWCNHGQALGYVSVAGAQGAETLELSGAARLGDSGGPVFNHDRELVAVLFGTNGRVVDGTFCGRVRRFLAGLSPRFGARQPAIPQQPPRPPGQTQPQPPLVEVPPRVAPLEQNRLVRLEGLVARLHEAWQKLSAKIDGLAAAVKSVRQARPDADANASRQPSQNAPGGDLDPLDPLARAAKPWLSGKVAAILVSLGVPGGIAGVAAGAIVYLAMRRGKRRLQAQLDRLKGRLSGATGDIATTDAPDAADPAVIRHHNRYVPFEVTELDKAWAAAHAHIGEKYPGAVPYLKMAEGVKDQLLSGNDHPTISQGRLS